MQVNSEEQFEAAFVDLAWSEMQNILDKEMPEEKKKRKLLWIWLLGTGLGLLSVAWLGWYYLSPKPLPSKTHFYQRPIAQQHDTNIIKNNNTENCQNEPSSNYSLDQANNTSSIVSISTKADLKNNASAFDTSSYAEYPSSKRQSLVVLDTLVTTPVEVVASFLPLPMDNNPILTFAERDFKDTHHTIPPKRKSSKDWMLGFRLGGAWNDKNHFDSYIGTYGAYSFYPKWNLQIGLHYYRTEYDITSFLPTVSMDAKLDSTSRVNIVQPNHGAALSELKSFTTSFLQVPLQINYKTGKRWQAQLGTALWINIPSKTQKETSVALLDMLDQSFISTSTTVPISIDTKPLPNTEFSFFAGLSYQFKPKWSIETQYYYQNETNPNGLGTVGLKYHW